MPVMQHAQNRALREEVYRAYLVRASSGELDNTNIISQILNLRLEKAKLLGYKNYAEVLLLFLFLATLKELHVIIIF
jgi:oligopeptidase A